MNKPRHKDSVVHDWIRQEWPNTELWTFSEVADYLDKSVLTVRRWVRDGLIDPPSMEGRMGSNLVYLFTEDDVRRFEAYSKVLRPGRPTEEYRDRLREVGKA